MTSRSISSARAAFHYVTEGNPFLSLFPHRFDFIVGDHSPPGVRPDWQTESRYPLSDRLLEQGAALYGVRFGTATCYCLLDIDISSPYHPQQDPFAVARIQAVLADLGLTAAIACTSSYSGGIHLYLPFATPQSSWEVAIVVSTLLETAGFPLVPGQLELFPNPKPYVVEGHPSLYHAHRLPMQAGSYLLDQDFQPIWSDRQTFAERWKLIQQRNDLSAEMLQRVLKQTRRKAYRVSGKADKFIADLNAEIEPGWTDFGQTNRILGRITLRSYIFHHILLGGEPLAGQALIDEIIAVARSLPGYQQWCRHQHEIEKKAAEWARCIENSAYFPYGTARGKYKRKSNNEPEAKSKPLSWNQQQSAGARDRIRQAVADLLEKETLPVGATARFQALLCYGIGGGSLYRHRDLWHPDYLWKTPPVPPSFIEDERVDSAGGASTRHSPTSLLLEVGGNALQQADFSDSVMLTAPQSGGNVRSEEISSWSEALNDSVSDRPLPSQIVENAGCPDAELPIAECVLSLQWQDLSDVLAAITVELRRLAWTPAELHDRLMARFHKPNPAMLDDWEVVQWLIWLRSQVSLEGW
jgi:hypothetical protein